MVEFLRDAASGPILILIAMLLISAAIFAAFIFFALSRRRKKSKMKLGIQPKKAPNSPEITSGSVDDLDISILSQSPPTIAASDKVNADLLAAPHSRQSTAADSVAPSQDFGSGPTVKTSDQEVLPLEKPKPLVEEKVELAARLGDQSSMKSPAPTELVRLLRDPETGQLLVEVAGQHYAKLAEITDRKIGQYILKVTAHLLAFTNGMIETDAGLKSVYNPNLGAAPEPIVAALPADQLPDATFPSFQAPALAQPTPSPAEPSFVPQPPPEAEAASFAPLSAQPKQPTPPRRGLLGRSRPAPQPTLPELNLADEINKIVQARLMTSPLAATTEIDITADLGGGIRIMVNGVPYSSPDEVPDAEVRELIKASIKQWERS